MLAMLAMFSKYFSRILKETAKLQRNEGKTSPLDKYNRVMFSFRALSKFVVYLTFAQPPMKV